MGGAQQRAGDVAPLVPAEAGGSLAVAEAVESVAETAWGESDGNENKEWKKKHKE